MSKRRKFDSTEYDEDLVEAIEAEFGEGPTPAPASPEKPKIPFAMWFDKMVKRGKLRHYHDEALLVFFKKQGLKDHEDEDSYNRAFEKF